MDMLCAAMLMEIIRSRLSRDEIEPDEMHTRVQKVYRVLNTSFREDVDLNKVASDNGLTLRTLRRHWDKYYPVSMKRFMLLKRMDEAQRLLKESKEPISRIAGLCGFDNPLYFSRKFHEMIGETPSGHRRTNGLTDESYMRLPAVKRKDMMS
jgi:transcriptional regulator GlxA family with amidase domain